MTKPRKQKLTEGRKGFTFSIRLQPGERALIEKGHAIERKNKGMTQYYFGLGTYIKLAVLERSAMVVKHSTGSRNKRAA